MTRVAIGNGAAALLAAFRTNAIDAHISVTSNIFNWEEKIRLVSGLTARSFTHSSNHPAGGLAARMVAHTLRFPSPARPSRRLI